jgi:hypothetical protein
MKFFLSTIALLGATSSVSGFAGMSNGPQSTKEISRRETFANVAAIVGAAAAFPSLASAQPTEETPRIVTRMGGNLVSRNIGFTYY